MVVNQPKIPPKYLFLFGVFTFIPFLVMTILLSVFLSGTAHGVPDEFAVDNEQRIYLSFESGLYVEADGQFVFLLPEERYGYALSVSEDDMLTIADPVDIRIVDLATSDLAAGHMNVVQKTRAPDNALFDVGRENWETDPQNGVTYRCESDSFYYEILREDKDGSGVFFAMPHSDYVWNIVAKACFALFFVYIGGGMLIIFRYTKKHPEAQIHVIYPWKIWKRQ